MLEFLRNARLKRFLRRHNIKLGGGSSGFRRGAALLLEEHVAINAAETDFTHLEIGAHSYLRSGSELLNVDRIGRFCSIGNDVILGQPARSHPLDWVSTHPLQFDALQKKPEAAPPLRIGHDVWIGRGALLMDGIEIGTGAVIAARSLVTRSVPPYAVVAGAPARIIKYRQPPEIISELLNSAWWNLDAAHLRTLPFDNPAEFLRLLPQTASPAVYNRVKVSRAGARLVNLAQIDNL